MDSLFSDLSTLMEEAIVETADLAANAGMPESTVGPILEGMSKRARLIDANK